MTRPLTQRQLATVLAALRCYQECYLACAGDLPDNLASIASDCDTLEPLNIQEIDALCEYLNVAPE